MPAPTCPKTIQRTALLPALFFHQPYQLQYILTRYKRSVSAKQRGALQSTYIDCVALIFGVEHTIFSGLLRPTLAHEYCTIRYRDSWVTTLETIYQKGRRFLLPLINLIAYGSIGSAYLAT